MRKVLFFVVLSIGLLGSCNRSDDASLVGVAEPVYIESFDNRAELTPDRTFKPDFYFNDFSIQDSLVFVSGNNSWEVKNIKDCKTIKKIFSIGHAATEFLYQIPWTYNGNFYEKDGDLHLVTYDFGKGSVYETNVTKTLSSDSLCIELVKYRVPKHSRYFYIDSTEFVIRESTRTECPKVLTHFKNGDIVQNKYFDRLNAVNTGVKDDWNILASVETFSRKHNVIAQSYLFFNVINVIPLDDSMKAYTLCVGKKGESLSNVVNVSTRKDYFCDIRAYDEFFAVLYIEDKARPSVLLFTYDGKPIREYVLRNPATSFDIDMNEQILYTYDFEDGMMTCYKLRE